MTPPPAAQGTAALPAPSRPVRRDSLRVGWEVAGRLRLAALAASVLAIVVAGTLAVRLVPSTLDGLATRAVGTAFLGTTTCADWHQAGRARRLAIVQSLTTAATAPDPETAGATLEDGAAFTLFHRTCSTTASRSALLYEAYNRAAAFATLRGVPSGVAQGFGTSLHH